MYDHFRGCGFTTSGPYKWNGSGGKNDENVFEMCRTYLGKADVDVDVAAPGVPKKRTFKKFSFRGVDLDALLDMSTDELVKLFPTRSRRRFQRGLKRKPMALIKKLCKAMIPCFTSNLVGKLMMPGLMAKREAPPSEKPEPVRMHLHNMIIVPEMISSIIGVYNGKTFNQVEIMPEMISTIWLNSQSHTSQ
ncbi:40S ribosomal protein S15 [Hibiscus syriacus]|uniref:40S ribosomal protein S15 n=1 Tax=Hibiscus syriacus TaxID=106335 RepID=A0A6A3CTD5_HIBSY|nr:40S ribosomal protein S15 [Hibiscus syriacus]